VICLQTSNEDKSTARRFDQKGVFTALINNRMHLIRQHK